MDPFPPWIPEVFVVPTRDGSNTVFSHHFGATYHSLFGAVSESKHVFIGEGLLHVQSANPIEILEFGFGSGLNALLAFQFGKNHSTAIHYTGVETVPLPEHVVRQLDYETYLGMPSNVILPILHSRDTGTIDDFTFRVCKSLEELPAEDTYHCIFFDAFAPNAQPECWETSVFINLFNKLKPGGVLVTYCARGEIRRILNSVGFSVSRISGPPGKREMLRAVKAPFL